MKLFITSGIVLSLAAFSGAQQVKTRTEQFARAGEYKSVKSAVVPPMPDIAGSTAAVIIIKPLEAKPAAAPAPAKQAEAIPPAPKSAQPETRPAAAVPAKPAVAVKPAGIAYFNLVWNDEVLASRAAHYGLTVDQYKKNNVLGTEVTSRDVAELAAELCGQLFAKTTGAQLPIDGGNERVI